VLRRTFAQRHCVRAHHHLRHPCIWSKNASGNSETLRGGGRWSLENARRAALFRQPHHCRQAPRCGQYPSLGLVDTRKPTLTSTHLGLDVYAALATLASCDHRSVPPSNVLTEIRSFAGRNARALPACRRSGDGCSTPNPTPDRAYHPRVGLVTRLLLGRYSRPSGRIIPQASRL
jgi:hypothetical protein